METISLTEGDLRWVFPDLEHPDEVLDTLGRASEQMQELADYFGVTPSWTGTGLEFHLFPGGWADIFGSVEPDEASFVAELGFALLSEGRSDYLWDVGGKIQVRCDARRDCGMHVIEEMPERRFDSPIDAANGLLDVVVWLRERGVGEPLSLWSRRDTQSRHT